MSARAELKGLNVLQMVFAGSLRPLGPSWSAKGAWKIQIALMD